MVRDSFNPYVQVCATAEAVAAVGF